MTMKWIVSVLLVLLSSGLCQAADYMKAFAPPEPGMVRYVLHLPQKENESLFKVELIPGKTVLLDGQNQYHFSGNIKSGTIKGWGFTQYRVGKLGPLAGTLMAPGPQASRQLRFIRMGGEPYLIRYNSKLPIVVYAPQGVELRYRIWTAAEAKAMQEG
jgi:ecotin